ncbi:hypothetical protein RHSIM_Rhsim08G0034100 [Rhododendron simsii]|uniref:Uncharacterized protein n=1 Tax=Rhododendron simsii TaxID=118357 RepID=A0A834LGS4_RHOSS|nr:hypothetical protein RHSIM_Rhsim08G0034100 [Rhododendron simsii]
MGCSVGVLSLGSCCLFLASLWFRAERNATDLVERKSLGLPGFLDKVLLRILSIHYSFDAKVFDLASVFTGCATSAMLLCHQDWELQTLLGLQNVYPLSDQIAVSGGNQTGMYPPLSNPSGSSATAPNLPVNLQFPHVATAAMFDNFRVGICSTILELAYGMGYYEGVNDI